MIKEILDDKTIKPKEKTEALCKWLQGNKKNADTLIEFAKTAKDSPRATCIEALEFVTKSNPDFANLKCLDFVSEQLTHKAPRVKWESAKVIGNIAPLFPGKLDMAIGNLLKNTEHEGTVVRWAAAYALGEILKTKSKDSAKLKETLEHICEREEKNSIKKIYLAAFKKM